MARSGIPDDDPGAALAATAVSDPVGVAALEGLGELATAEVEVAATGGGAVTVKSLDPETGCPSVLTTR